MGMGAVSILWPSSAPPGTPNEKILLKMRHFILVCHKGQFLTRTVFLLEQQRDNWFSCGCFLPYFTLTLEKFGIIFFKDPSPLPNIYMQTYTRSISMGETVLLFAMRTAVVESLW